MDTPALSVVIPTHKRPKELRLCLDHLAGQTIAKQLEVIVVSDGEDSEARAVTQARTWPFICTFFEIPKAQQGVARNHGVAHANAPVVLFLGDDCMLDPYACIAHVDMHTMHE